MSALPKVSVLMPARNESASIRRAIDDLRAQDYPADRIDFWIAEGRSDDDTAEQIRAIAREDARVHLVDNPGRIVPTGLNLAIERAPGEVIVRADAHTRYATDYVRRAVEVLAETGADVVGGPMVPEGDSSFGRAVAAAHRSRVGVGGSSFHFSDRAGEAECVYLGVFRAEAFRRFGDFDEFFTRNQDDEWFYRARSRGARIWLDPRIRSVYRPRSDLGALFRQYLGYGRYKPAVLAKVPGGARPRHFAPAGLVGAVAATACAPFSAGLGVAGGTLLLAYGLLLSLGVRGAVRETPGARWASAVLACATMHLAYGLGFLRGLLRRAPGQAREEMRRTYVAYEEDAATRQRWSEANPGQRGLLDERDRALARVLAQALGDRAPTARILDLGAGSRDLAAALREQGVRVRQVVRADLLAFRLQGSGAVVADGRRLPFAEGCFDAVVQCTMLSSVLVHATRRVIAAEMERVCRAEGAIVSYDAALPNPFNPQVRRVSRKECRQLFTGSELRFEALTKIPPLARRLPALAEALPASRLTCAFDLAVVKAPRTKPFSEPPRGASS